MKRRVYLIIVVTFLLDRYFKDILIVDKIINPGFSFSVVLPLEILLLIFGALILITLYSVFKVSGNASSQLLVKHKLALLFIFTGGFSNFIDRFIYGGVVDYLNFFGVLKNNLADYLIIFGVIALIVGLFLKKEYIK